MTHCSSTDQALHNRNFWACYLLPTMPYHQCHLQQASCHKWHGCFFLLLSPHCVGGTSSGSWSATVSVVWLCLLHLPHAKLMLPMALGHHAPVNLL